MKPLKLSFTTFLKICTRKTRGQISEVGRFTGAGGYDFYKKMKKLAGQLAREEISIEDAKTIIANITRQSEREHTLAAIERLYSLLQGWDFEWCTPPSGSYVSDSKLLIIKLEPELAFKKPNGEIECLHIWNLAKPEMTKELAGEGLWLSSNELGKPNNTLGILDLRKKKIIGEDAITEASGLQLQLDLLRVEEIWKDAHNPALTYEDKISHISSLSLPPP